MADDDPSGIATYSQAGAQFGLNMLWTMPLAFPLMAAIQSMCARIGRVTAVSGVKDIETAAQAASALPPLAGDFAFMLFALGILGVGLVGVPVLAGSAAYALAEAMDWKWGLERKATEAHGFYAVIAVSVLAGLVIQYSPISPMKALFWSAVINGVVAVPLMVVIILLVSTRNL